MKKAVALFLSVLMAFAMTACGQSEAAPAGAAGAADTESKPTVVVGMAWSILDDGQTATTDGIKKYFDGLEDVNVEYTLTNADSDMSKLVSDVESLAALEPDIIILQNSVGSADVTAQITQYCIDQGIKVISMQVEGGLTDKDGNLMTVYVDAFSQYGCGALQAEYMESIYDPEKEYKLCIVDGVEGVSASADRVAGFVENFADKHDNVETLVSGFGMFSTDAAQTLMEDWLVTYPEVNLVSCVNDEEAQGVYNACAAAGRDDVLIVGIDGNVIGKSLVDSGRIACTVELDNEMVGQIMAKSALEFADGTSTEPELAFGNQAIRIYSK